MNGTILSSLYPHLKVAKFLTAELEGNKTSLGTRERVSGNTVVVNNFLPTYHCQKKDSKISFDLVVREIQADSSDWLKVKKARYYCKSCNRGTRCKECNGGKDYRQRNGVNNVVLFKKSASGEFERLADLTIAKQLNQIGWGGGIPNQATDPN